MSEPVITKHHHGEQEQHTHDTMKHTHHEQTPPPVVQPVAPPKGITEGRIAHYVAFNHRHLASIIIGHEGGGKVDLAVFTNMPNANGVKNFGTQFHQDIEYSDEKKPGTWHFPEPVP